MSGKFHFTKATVQAALWCNKCGKETPRRLGERRAPCLVCFARLEVGAEKTTPRLVQGGLFGGGE